MNGNLKSGGLRRRDFASGIALLGLGACAVRPEPETDAGHAMRAVADRAAVQAARVPVNGPLSLSDALARGVAFNQDAQLARLETTMAERQLDAAVAQMLPRLAANAGYTSRDSNPSATSISEATGRRSLEPSYSTERDVTRADLTFSWNALDLGMSYYTAKQQGFRALIAVERRRKAMDSLARSVVETYWKASSAGEIMPRLDPALRRAERVLAASRAAGERNLQAPVPLLEFQQAMIRVTGELRRLKTDMTSSRIQLASLVSAEPGTLTLADRAGALRLTSSVDAAALEEVALAMRPELRIEAYQGRIDRQEVYKEILRMMPGVGAVAGVNFDSNRLLTNNVWGEIGARVTFNLVSLIQGPRSIAAARATEDVTRQRRLALAVAVVSQVNLAAQNYLAAVEAVETAENVASVGRQMARASANTNIAGVQSDSDRMRYELTSMVAAYERDKAVGAAHAALAALWSSAGVDLVPADVDIADFGELSRRTMAHSAAWRAGELPRAPAGISDALSAARVSAVTER